MGRRRQQQPDLPTRADILAFVRASDSPVGKREIARAFRLYGTDRRVIGAFLEELEDEGLVRRSRGRRYRADEHLPSVTVLEVVGFDADGDAIVGLADSHAGHAPRIRLMADGGRGRAPAAGDRVLARLTPQPDGAYAARIMRVLERRPARFFGVFRAGHGGGGRVELADRRLKSEFLVAEDHVGGAEDGELVACETLPGRAFGLPLGRVVERIGRESDARSVSPLVIARNEIPDAFAAAALREAEDATAAPLDGRDDLREMALVTIDGEDARDYDDAVWAEADDDPTNPGGWHLVVAIADVAWYVRPGSALDGAARERGNSVYLPDRVVPMLPEPLSNGWCSLIPGEDRPCLAVDIWIDAAGNKLRHRFRRAMMRSAARLTYTQVQRAHDRASRQRDTVPAGILEPLYGAFAALFRAREARGAIDLDMPERKVVLAEDGTVERIAPRVRYDSHRLIEEFMILANVCAAETLDAVGQPCMYRLHDEPAPDRIAALRAYLQSIGLRLGGGQAVRPRHFAHLVARLRGRPDAAAVQDAILRAQSKAEYGPDNLGHFGLALRNYAHFTSPIRRYADLLVHRGLIAGLHLGAGGLDRDTGQRFAEIGAHVSMTERRAMTAEREAFDRLATLFLADRVGVHFPARITGVEPFGLFVELESTGASGLLPASALGDERYRYDERMRALLARSGEGYRLGDSIVVRLTEADLATGRLLFEPAGGRPAPRRRKGPSRPAGRGRGRR